MAAAMPVISTRFCGAAIDMIEPEVGGVCLDEVDGPAVAAAMRRFLDRPGDIATMGAAARVASAAYDHRTGARRFIDAITTAVRGS
jgi:glycosyltransferase involved in cell wall biosynthesis